MISEQVLAVPLDGFLEALLKWRGGFVAEQFLGGGDVSEGVFYIAGARGGVNRLYIFAEQLVNYINNFIDGYSLAAGDIYDFASGVLGPCSEQVGLDHIVNVSKIPALFAVAKNSWRLVF